MSKLCTKKEEVEEEEKVIAAIKKQIEEKVLVVWNKQQFKGTHRNCGKYGHKVVHYPEKKSDEIMNDKNSNVQ